MLLEFKASNYKSFKDEFILSLTPAPKQKGLDYSVMEAKVGSKTYKGLCSSVIYGPNASGKTNIIGALDTFRSIVLRGHIRNNAEHNGPNAAAGTLELIPNETLDEPLPVEFSITFIEQGVHVEYSFSVDIGTFLEDEYERKILSETLVINNSLVFARNAELEFGDFENIQNFVVNAFEQNADGAIALAKGNLSNQELFLVNGFKTMFSSRLVSLITDWIDKKLMVVYRAESIRLTQKFNDFPKKAIFVDKLMNEAVNSFGITSNELGYMINNDNGDAKLYSLFRRGNDDKARMISADLFESYGTIRFINMFPLVDVALQNGGTLIVDEFDASIHPMVLMSIINIFHNDEININHAQLMFNTHNPIFLNSNIFRRDEIKFVERDDETHLSSIYSLSDFGTTGKNGVRKNEDYMKNYFVSRYGAIKDIDFAPVFESLLLGEKEG